MEWEDVYKKETGKDARYEYWEGGTYGYYNQRVSEDYVLWLEEKLDKTSRNHKRTLNRLRTHIKKGAN